jgi:hypothetical protein
LLDKTAITLDSISSEKAGYRIAAVGVTLWRVVCGDLAFRDTVAAMFQTLSLTFKRARKAVNFSCVIAARILLKRDRALLSFERTTENPYYVYLVFALAPLVTIGCSLRDAYRVWNWLPLRLFFRSTRVNWRAPVDGLLLSENRQGAGIISVNPHYYSAASSEDILFAPYFANPDFYKAGLHIAARKMRGRDRSIRIFFAGDHSKPGYSEYFSFPLLTRDKILDCIIARCAENAARGSIVVISTEGLDDKKLPLKRYIERMSQSHFSICPPGAIMPHSHNLVEAMSVGAIPILNYHSYLHPPLAPDRNCLAFSTIQELEKVIDRALEMESRDILRLRHGVIDYYDEHLDPESFGKKLLQRAAALPELVVNDEWLLWAKIEQR